ncbi:uncharacterized protein A4U43_C04F16510 [Asparagus officinalis]|uniref:Uncharacterized protein n=1 Tax=Asparagus officinalis TaxID=4686 RepID=A0A5P1F6Q3_ASPOF|nr:protein IQ-DOMAIN 32 [Asparagus officinalis]ONK72170.1 uncharacterized protein A4U43_C04F16510 [Asparagus officinalis]
MGKSPNSCFKIISCGAESTDADDELLPPESKQSSDKRRWSFRKRSARHQVPSNTVISEPQFVGANKEIPEATTDKFYPVKDSSVPEKYPVVEKENVTEPLSSAVSHLEKPSSEEQKSETTSLAFAAVNSGSSSVVEQANETVPFSSAAVDPEVKVTSDTGEITTSTDVSLQEKVAVIIQAAARRFLAQRELQKLKYVVKLQCAVRGHLVRSQAIGTLRCVQAIAKMQTLVRARRAHQFQLLQKCTEQGKVDEEFHNDLVKRSSDIKSNKTNSTMEKLLSNGFARQLLESTPKTTRTRIICDPLRHDSSWQWLERWMTVISSKVGQEQNLNCIDDYQGQEKISNSTYGELDVIPVEASVLSGSNMPAQKSSAAKGDGDLKIDYFGNFESQASAIVSVQNFSFSAEGDKEHSEVEEFIGMKEENIGQTVGGKESTDAGSQSKHDNYPNCMEYVKEDLNRTTETDASDLADTEGKKSDLGSKKIRNPAFAAVQAKFEELSSAPQPVKSVSVWRDTAVESKPNYSQVVSVAKDTDASSTLNLSTQNSTTQIAASECGTEISISSTLDSPDRSETDGGEIVLEIGTSGEGNHNLNTVGGEAFNAESIKTEERILSSASDETKAQRPNHNDENTVTAIDSLNVEEQPVEIITPGIWSEQENLKMQAYRLSPEGSPRNHMTVPESHDTPSSQVSIQSKTSKSESSNMPSQKSKSKSRSKKSPSTIKSDLDDKSSNKHLLRDAKNGNRQSSFAAAKTDHTDDETRRSSTTSLPSYMQATESARAKAHGSLSLKSSPDVHDKDNHLKKRHSLPIGDEKKDSSPRVQRSASQTLQSSKRNSSHSPQTSSERRWQR